MDVDWTVFFFAALSLQICCAGKLRSQLNDILIPYTIDAHNPFKSHRQARDCQPVKYGNATHTKMPSHGQTSSTITLPIATTKHFVKDFQFTPFETRVSMGHISFVNNPRHTIAVLEPLTEGGCDMRRRATVLASSEQKKCIVSVNAGFFNTNTGECYGNIVSDGRMVKNSNGIQNAHFGIRKDGSLVFGYLSENDVEDSSNPFVQLVGGVGWLLRDGEIYVDTSMQIECDETEETGTTRKFFEVVSARSVIGSDAAGRVVIAQVDGQTNKFGVDLHTMAEFLKDLGVVNAINLDGGGSSTYVVNGTVVNYPTDTCFNTPYKCDRQVSTIICAHEPECHPTDCSKHGDCILGTCHCHNNWRGSQCDQLYCGSNNCGSHGNCTSDGCICEAGWEPPYCVFQCPMGRYGVNCNGTCHCGNGAVCDITTGACHCLPGYHGVFCNQVCPVGYYGQDCQEICYCPSQSCLCHHVTGNCDVAANYSDHQNLFETASCMATDIVEQTKMADTSRCDQNEEVGLIVVSSIAALSIMCNILLICFQCVCKCNSKPFHSKVRQYAQINSGFDSE